LEAQNISAHNFLHLGALNTRGILTSHFEYGGLIQISIFSWTCAGVPSTRTPPLARSLSHPW